MHESIAREPNVHSFQEELTLLGNHNRASGTEQKTQNSIGLPITYAAFTTCVPGPSALHHKSRQLYSAISLRRITVHPKLAGIGEDISATMEVSQTLCKGTDREEFPLA